MRLIDADKFLSIMKVLNCNLLNLKDIENYIKIYGTVDPESLRKHALWMKITCSFLESENNAAYVCSNCGWYRGDLRFKYCPNCGAKMDLEDKK